MSRPLIGITTQTLEAIPGQLPACWVMGQHYVNSLVAVGAVPWVVPLIADDEDTLRAIYDELDGVFLPGGVDMDPSTYHETTRPECGRTDPARDRTELALTRWALADRKPILAVCRGAQVVNVACGGTLYQDLAVDRADSIKHDYFPTDGRYSRDFLSHKVRVNSGTQLASIMGEGEVPVNSMHHQGIKLLAPGLVVTAVAPDGVIEGVEMDTDQFLVGVQWHPESLTEQDARMRRLFSAFISASADYHGGHVSHATPIDARSALRRA